MAHFRHILADGAGMWYTGECNQDSGGHDGPPVQTRKTREMCRMPHFCTCQNTACRCHPSNHDQGCDLCIQKELRKGEIPSCFFNLVIQPGETVEDCTIEGFARRVLERG